MIRSNIMIVNSTWCANKAWDDAKIPFQHFNVKYISSQVLPLQTIQMLDVLIVTDGANDQFMVVKCRIPQIPEKTVMPGSYMKHTIDLIEYWDK